MKKDPTRGKTALCKKKIFVKFYHILLHFTGFYQKNFLHKAIFPLDPTVFGILGKIEIQIFQFHLLVDLPSNFRNIFQIFHGTIICDNKPKRPVKKININLVSFLSQFWTF